MIARVRRVSSGRSGASRPEQAHFQASRVARRARRATSPSTLHRASRDQPPRLARRHAERGREHRRQVHGIAVREAATPGTSSGRLALAHDPREVRLRLRRGLLPVRPRDDEPRERELRLQRVAGRRRLLEHEPIPLGELGVRRSASSGRTAPRAPSSAGCCCRRTSSSSRRPRTRRSGVVSATCGSRPYASITSRPASRL